MGPVWIGGSSDAFLTYGTPNPLTATSTSTTSGITTNKYCFTGSTYPCGVCAAADCRRTARGRRSPFVNSPACSAAQRSHLFPVSPGPIADSGTTQTVSGAPDYAKCGLQTNANGAYYPCNGTVGLFPKRFPTNMFKY